MRNPFAPPPHQPRLSDDEVRRLYPRYRVDILASTYFGYAFFYLVRNNLATVSKDIGASLHYDDAMLGHILAASAIAYGVGKFLMGALSDRSDPRKFMAFGLLLSAIVNWTFGGMNSEYVLVGPWWVKGYHIHLGLWSLNGLIQGMGWPPCGRAIGHWFSVRERGFVFSIWNTATNVGGGLAGYIAARATLYFGWQSAFYFPAAMATVGSLYLFWRLRDTPQSVGLPSIEEFKDDFTEEERRTGTHEQELSTRELFVTHILKNRLLWVVAAANFFVYIARYSMLDWGPMYLRDVKGADLTHGGIAILLLEFGGIPSTILMGWFSDKMGGRRGMVSLLCMFPVVAAFVAIRLNPPGHLWFDMAMLVTIGFFVYPPVMLLALAGLDLTSKKAVGTAAGLIGLFGYLGRTAQAEGFGWMAKYYKETIGVEAAWNRILTVILVCALGAIVLLSFTWKVRPRA